eukprot:CAMPEP_0175139226 /NCGR_PEP_ID=MMETSP0087-20121206/10782_1 /TAXON_ID=136419 /ORGANISM="Unknown Unknown, Strain D1" /LENGTH=729 /DNA_ID=CAMNT_0016422207 /DNA_START=89 /DNA_END=2278 /DNA_ORIENTATION=+
MSSRGIQVNVAEIVEDHSIRRPDDSTYVKRYKRGRYLGKGGFAKCYELTSMDSNRTYAGKIIPKSSLAKPSSRKKLLNEIKIHRSIRDPNVVRFERFFEDKENVYILLELCPNHSLMELLKRRKRLTETETQYYMWQIVQTVKHLHSNNVIHRDLKLGNLFLSDKLEIKAGDFGLAARLSHPDERKRTICGTPNYIAPEILDNQNGHSFEVDIWAMGVIMYTMLIGRPPFETASVKSTYKKIRANSYVFPSHIQISKAAKELIVRILHSQPELRPTLDDMARHPFFTQSPIPSALPISCLNTPYTGESSTKNIFVSKDNYVQLNSADAARAPLGEKQVNLVANSVANKQPEMIPASNEVRVGQENAGARTSRNARSKPLPFGAHDNQPLYAKNAAAPLSAWGSNEAAKPLSRPMTRSASLKSTASPTPALPNKSPDVNLEAGSVNIVSSNGGKLEDDRDKDDADEVRAMHDQIEKSFLVHAEPDAKSEPVFAQPSSKSEDLKPAELWVNKWVDYSNKYGLGYLLSNGNAGVYFNDSSKLILHKNGTTFEHIPRRSSSANTAPTREKLDLENYPPSLQKKVTLLKHFRNYLLQHSGTSASDDNNANIGNSNANPPIEKQPGDENQVHMMDLSPDQGNNRPEKMVYVKKWLRTKHAILFRLSDRTVQVIFYDHTEVILSSENQMVTYTNKERQRKTYPLQTVFQNPKPDLAKRMKYIKDILFHLLSHKPRS